MPENEVATRQGKQISAMARERRKQTQSNSNNLRIYKFIIHTLLIYCIVVCDIIW